MDDCQGALRQKSNLVMPMVSIESLEEPLAFEDIIDWSLKPADLRRLYKRTEFSTKFVKLISKNVIKILSPQLVAEPHNLVYDEELVYDQLLGPLERFICDLDPSASSQEVNRVFDELSASNQSSKLCRRILKFGDVTFSCNDCGLDTTCVVCIDCFHKSAHKDHNYRMSNSDGGGCCDCGDPEAWKQNYACTDHIATNQVNPTLANFEDEQLRAKQIELDHTNAFQKLNLLPKSIVKKYFFICQAALHYAYDILICEDYESLPKWLQIDDPNADPELESMLNDSKARNKNWFSVLFNDEVHTYDHVINTLVKITKCTKMTASIMASTISREGRSIVVNDTYSDCNKIKRQIMNVRDSVQNPLKIETIHGSVLAHQAFALKLIGWIRKLSSISDAFRLLTAYTLLGTYDKVSDISSSATSNLDTDEQETLVEGIMMKNTHFWKIVRVEWNDLFVTTLLTEYSIKADFARLITKNYRQLMNSFIKDDHDHSVSILTMTTQLYTVPSLICMLVEEGAMSKILSTFLDICRDAKRQNRSITFESRYTFNMDSLRRGFYAINDFRHLINIEPTKWNDELRRQVILAAELFLDLLELMQGMDSVKRQVGQHLEYEPDWESGMTLQGKLIGLISRLVDYCSYDEKVLVSVLKLTLKRLQRECGYMMIKKELEGHQASCIQYDVTTSPVSVHLPLTRFAAALILQLMQRRPCDRLPYDESLVISADDEVRGTTSTSTDNNAISERSIRELLRLPNETMPSVQASQRPRMTMVEIMEPSLRAEVMIAQFRSGMWRRNGYSLVNQIIFFLGAFIRKEMFDRDILVLQECAAMTDPNEFMIHLINKFQLFTWILSETTKEPFGSSGAGGAVARSNTYHHNDEEIMTQTMSLGEEFLQLILTIVGERYQVGVGKIEEDDVIKNEIIQLLCISPSTRSDLSQKLNVCDNELDCMKAVANLKRSTEASTGKYELKDEFYDRFNPFFYHYTRRNQSNAFEAQLKRKKTLGHPLACCPPPEPVELTSQFKQLNELLKCDILLLVIQKVLLRSLGPQADKDSQSDGVSTMKAPAKFTASELQLDQCLHLIGLGLWEQERNPVGFNYLKPAYNYSIFSLIKQSYDTIGRSKDLMLWLMKKVTNLIVRINRDHANTIDRETSKMFATIGDYFKAALGASDALSSDSKKRNSELAAQRRDRIMAMMKANQDKFLSNPNTKQLMAESSDNLSTSGTSHQSQCPAPATAPQTAKCGGSGAGGGSSSSSSGGTRSRTVKIRLLKSVSSWSKKSHPLATTATSSYRSSASCQDNSSTNLSRSAPAGNSMGAGAMDFEVDDKMDSESINDEDIEGDEEIEIEEPTLVVQPDSSHLCILCRAEQNIGFDQPTMVLLAYIQRSAVLSKNREERRIPNYSQTPANHIKYQPLFKASRAASYTPEMYSFTTDNSWCFDATYQPADLFFSPHVSTCGHVMHYDCWKTFFDTVLKRETSRHNRGSRHVSFEAEKHEILCPLCECISNTTIPLLPNYTNFAKHSKFVSNDDGMSGQTDTIFNSPLEIVNKSSDMLSSFLNALRGSVDTFKHIRHIKDATASCGHHHHPQEDKYFRLMQPRNISDVLEELNEHSALSLRDFITTIRADKISSSNCTKSLLASMAVLSERIHHLGLDLDRSVSEVNHDRLLMMTSWSLAYTIQAHERVSRFKGSPIFDDLDLQSKNFGLSALARYACSSMLTQQSDMVQSLLLRKLRYLLISEEHLSSSPCCLDIDAFEMFVSIFMMLQKLYSHLDDLPSSSCGTSTSSSGSPTAAAGPTTSTTDYIGSLLTQDSQARRPSLAPSGTSDSIQYGWVTQAFDHEYYRNWLHLMLVLNMVQVIISMQNESNDAPSSINSETNNDPGAAAAATHGDDNDYDDDQAEVAMDTGDIDGGMSSIEGGKTSSAAAEIDALESFVRDLLTASGHPNGKLTCTGHRLVTRVKGRLLCFLRSCALFFFHLSHIPPPPQLCKKSAFFECAPSNGASSSGNQNKAHQSGFYVSQTMANFNQYLNLELANEEFESLCQYLDLPSQFNLILASKEARHLARGWLRHSRVILLIKSELKARDEEQQRQAALATVAASIGGAKQLRRVGSSSASIQSYQSALSCTSTQSYSTATTIPFQVSTSLASSDAGACLSSKTELMPMKFIQQPHLVNKLIDLPYDFSELVDMISDFSCPSIKNEDSRTPTLCLVCGVMLCSQSYCCQRDLNDLASNYPQLQRQLELRKASAAIGSALAAAAAAGASSSGSSGAAASQPAASSAAQVPPGPAAAGQQLALVDYHQPFRTLADPTAPVPTGDGSAVQSAVYAGTGPAAAMLIAPGTGGGGPGAGGGPAPSSQQPHHHHAHQYQQQQGGSSTSSLASSAAASASIIQQQLVGSCTYHAYECSGGVGVFLRIRNCQIMLLSGRSKGCYMPAPYIDDHGEADFGLVRGNPLHLNKEHYKRIQQMWLNHAIPEQISRSLEYSNFFSNINWHLH